MRTASSLAVGVIVACVNYGSVGADACSFAPGPDVRFFQLEAPAGGVWWVHSYEISVPSVALVDEQGVTYEVEVISRGAQTSAALRVPNAPVGTRFPLPDTFERPGDDWDVELVVADGSPDDAESAPPEPPVMSVSSRETKVGYSSVLVSPLGNECSEAAGLWNHQYADAPFVSIDDPGPGVVLDVELQPLDEEPFSAPESANEILFDARMPDAIAVFVQAPPDAESGAKFAVNARLRRVSDGAESEVVSVEAEPLSDDVEERLEWVGCGCHSTLAPTDALSSLGALVGLRAFVARRRSKASGRSRDTSRT